MFIYFLEQVWCLDEIDWHRLGWMTHETQARFWDHWHLTDAYKYMIVYPQEHMEEGNDYIDF